MATLTWVGGGNNRASNPHDWSPAQIPVSGDVLMMPLGGTMNIADTDLAGNTLEIGSAQAGSITTSLNLSHHAEVSLNEPFFSGTFSQINISVSGRDTLSINAPISSIGPFSGGPFVVDLAPDARLTASLDLNYSKVTVNGAKGAELINDGSTTFAGTSATINADVLGSGSFEVTALPTFMGLLDTGYLEFGDAVSRGETVDVGQSAQAQAGVLEWDELKIDQPREFHGSVVLQPNAFIELVGLAKADSYSYSNDILSIWSGDHVIDTLRLTNQSGGDLVVATDASGDAFVEPSGPSPVQGLTPLPLHETSYTFTTLNAPGATETFAEAINDRGQVAGNYVTSGTSGSEYSGFIYENGTFTTLNAPGATVTGVSAINDRGEVAGDYVDSSGGMGAFVDDNGTFTTLNAPNALFTDAQAINNRGEVAGTYRDSSGEHGFVYDNGTFTTLNVPGASTTIAASINNRGEVAGTYGDSSGAHGFIYDNGTYTTLNAPGATETDAAAINDHGEVAGYYADSSGGMHAFVDDNGTFTTLNPPGAVQFINVTINDRGEVAGTYYDSSFTARGFIYDNGTLTTLDVPGATSTTINAINDRGEVAGYYDDSSGEHAFLATPEGGEASAAGFGELRSAHASQGGVNDLLPGIPGIGGGSPSAANGPGMMDQTAGAGARFASFGGLASDQTATQALLHAGGTSPGTG